MKSLFIASLVLSSFHVFGQDGINRLALEEDRQYMKNIFVESRYKELDKLLRKNDFSAADFSVKKVGLLTFAHFEQDFKKDKGLISYQYEKKGKSIIHRIFESSLPSITNAIELYGVDLITPYDFSEDQLKLYKEALESIKAMSAKKIDLYDRLDETKLTNTPSGIGFAPVFLNDGNHDKINDILGELCSSLELDALLSIQITTNHFNYSIAFTNALMMVSIPCPVPESKTKGQQLASYYYMTQAPVGFIGLEKGEVVTGEDLSGFPILLSRMTDDFFKIITLEEEILRSN